MGLNCSAKDCNHNNGGACCAGAIVVDGRQAVTTSETCCKNYSPSAGGLNTEFAQEFNTLSKTTDVKDIKCKACNCQHNVKKCCHASSVQMNAQSGACDTFSVE
ncbi:MAG: DUF1540 domain-containing protein [Turicibacter sp.]